MALKVYSQYCLIKRDLYLDMKKNDDAATVFTFILESQWSGSKGLTENICQCRGHLSRKNVFPIAAHIKARQFSPLPLPALLFLPFPGGGRSRPTVWLCLAALWHKGSK